MKAEAKHGFWSTENVRCPRGCQYGDLAREVPVIFGQTKFSGSDRVAPLWAVHVIRGEGGDGVYKENSVQVSAPSSSKMEA